VNRIDEDQSRRILTDQASHYTAYGRRDAKEMGDRVCVQKFILSTNEDACIVGITVTGTNRDFFLGDHDCGVLSTDRDCGVA